MTQRPPLDADLSVDCFYNWYWTREELSAFCQAVGLRQNGSKADLFARVHAHLAGRDQPPVDRRRGQGAVNWARDTLNTETIIDEGVSFGPNFRQFMIREIGMDFVCHGDFMAWVKGHMGLTLADAIAAWRALEARKHDPEFRREIAADNQYLQYVRDFTDDNPHLSAVEARTAWAARRKQPAPGGRITYNPGDVALTSGG